MAEFDEDNKENQQNTAATPLKTRYPLRIKPQVDYSGQTAPQKREPLKRKLDYEGLLRIRADYTSDLSAAYYGADTPKKRKLNDTFKTQQHFYKSDSFITPKKTNAQIGENKYPLDYRFNNAGLEIGFFKLQKTLNSANYFDDTTQQLFSSLPATQPNQENLLEEFNKRADTSIGLPYNYLLPDALSNVKRTYKKLIIELDDDNQVFITLLEGKNIFSARRRLNKNEKIDVIAEGIEEIGYKDIPISRHNVTARRKSSSEMMTVLKSSHELANATNYAASLGIDHRCEKTHIIRGSAGIFDDTLVGFHELNTRFMISEGFSNLILGKNNIDNNNNLTLQQNMLLHIQSKITADIVYETVEVSLVPGTLIIENAEHVLKWTMPNGKSNELAFNYQGLSLQKPSLYGFGYIKMLFLDFPNWQPPVLQDKSDLILEDESQPRPDF